MNSRQRRKKRREFEAKLVAGGRIIICHNYVDRHPEYTGWRWTCPDCFSDYPSPRKFSYRDHRLECPVCNQVYRSHNVSDIEKLDYRKTFKAGYYVVPSKLELLADH